MPPYDVLVVDDSVFMRKIISDFIGEDPELRVVGTARNGREAIEMVKKLNPNAVTMDIEMPEMNGLDALRTIMREHPVPVIMLSSLTQAGAMETIRALDLGAFDFVGKPSGSISLDLYKVKQNLLEKLRVAVRTKVKGVHAPIRPVSSQTVKPAVKTEKRSVAQRLRLSILWRSAPLRAVPGHCIKCCRKYRTAFVLRF